MLSRCTVYSTIYNFFKLPGKLKTFVSLRSYAVKFTTTLYRPTVTAFLIAKKEAYIINSI